MNLVCLITLIFVLTDFGNTNEVCHKFPEDTESTSVLKYLEGLKKLIKSRRDSLRQQINEYYREILIDVQKAEKEYAEEFRKFSSQYFCNNEARSKYMEFKLDYNEMKIGEIFGTLKTSVMHIYLYYFD